MIVVVLLVLFILVVKLGDVAVPTQEIVILVALAAPLVSGVVGVVVGVLAVRRRLWPGAVTGFLSFIVGPGTLIGAYVYLIRNPCPPSYVDSWCGIQEAVAILISGLVAAILAGVSVIQFRKGTTRQQVVGRCPECGSTMLRGERGCRFCTRQGGQKPLRP